MIAEHAAAVMRVLDATKTTAVIKMIESSSIPRYRSPTLAIRMLIIVVNKTNSDSLTLRNKPI